VYRLRPPRAGSGHEQRGPRYGVVVQATSLLGLSTVLVAPTSTSAQGASWRPPIELDGIRTLILVDQVEAVTARRLGDFCGCLDPAELAAVDHALLMAFGLSTPGS
jgi:mRNA interferase MazF